MFDGSTSPITAETIVTVFSGSVTPAIAVIVAIIAWQNWETNRGVLREKLFERRFEIFRETQQFLTMLTGKDDNLDVAIWRFSDTCQRSRFLFGSVIFEYLEGIRERACDTQFQQSVIRNPAQYDDHIEQARLYTENKKWYYSQLVTIFEEFSPYLSFEKHK